MARSNQSPLTCVCGSNKGGLSHRKTEKDLSCRSALLAQNTTPVRREKRTTHFFVLKSECKKTTLSPASDKQRPRLKCKFHYAGVFSLSFFFGLYVAVDVLWFSLVQCRMVLVSCTCAQSNCVDRCCCSTIPMVKSNSQTESKFLDVLTFSVKVKFI